MPGFTLHYLFGVQAYQKLCSSPLKKVIQNHHCAYALGLQGPDIFFYYPPSHMKRRNMGSILHEGNPHHLFASMFMEYDQIHAPKEKQVIKAYIAGFLGHYVLDSSFHPYVYGRTDYHAGEKNGFEYYGRHFELEGAFDLLYLKKFRNLTPKSFYQNRTIALSTLEQTSIARFLSAVIARAYHENCASQNLSHAISCMRIGTALLHDTTGWKRNCYQFFERKLLGYDWLSPMFETAHQVDPVSVLNLNHKPWYNPWASHKKSTQSADDLLLEAGSRYYKILQCFSYEPLEQKESYARLLSVIGSLSFQSGLPVDSPSNSENL